MKRPLGLSSRLSDHSVLEHLSTCQLGAQVNDRLALAKWQGGGAENERALQKVVGRVLLFVSLDVQPSSCYSYPGVHEEVGAREDRGESSSPHTSYKFTGHDWVMGFQPSLSCFCTLKLLDDNKQGEAKVCALTHTHTEGDLRPTYLIIM